MCIYIYYELVYYFSYSLLIYYIYTSYEEMTAAQVLEARTY